MNERFEIHEERLDNGLRILIAPMAHIRRAHLSLGLPGGPRFEDEGSWGFSHIVEHMVFRGTASHPSPLSVAQAAEVFGGEIDAATGRDRVTFETRVDPAALDAAAHLLAEMVSAPRFAGLEIEKRILREELLEGYDERGQEIDADNLVFEELLAGHPLARSIEGTLEGLEGCRREDLLHFRELNYGMRGAVLVLAGGVTVEAGQKALRRAFAPLPPGAPRPVQDVPLPPLEGPRYRKVETEDSQTELRLAFRTAGFSAPETPALSLLGSILDDGPTTRLPARLVDARGLAYDLEGALELYREGGVFEVAASVEHDRVEEAVEAICDELEDLVPDADERHRARERARREVEDLHDLPEALSEELMELALSDLPLDPAHELRAWERLDDAALAAQARALFDPGRALLLFVGRPEGAKRARKRFEGLRPRS